MAGGHDHDHRPRLARRDQVVEDHAGAADGGPRVVAIARPVQQVEDRVLALALLVARRRVDVHPAELLQRRGVIGDLRDRAVGHVLQVEGLRARDEDQAPGVGVRLAGGGVARVDDGQRRPPGSCSDRPPPGRGRRSSPRRRCRPSSSRPPMPTPGRSLLPSRTASAFGAWIRNVTLRSGETSVDANSGGRFPFGLCARAGSARPEHAIISQAPIFVARVMLDLGEERGRRGFELCRDDPSQAVGTGILSGKGWMVECPRRSSLTRPSTVDSEVGYDSSDLPQLPHQIAQLARRDEPRERPAEGGDAVPCPPAASPGRSPSATPAGPGRRRHLVPAR